MNFSRRKLKLALVAYAKKHDVSIPKVGTKTGLWGKHAQTAAWRVSGDIKKRGRNIMQSAKPTLQLAKALGVPVKKPFKIQKVKLDWNGPLSRRIGRPKGTVWHHEDCNDHNPHDGLQDVLGVHAYHRSLGWLGFAYMFFVAFDGTVFRGRPEWAFGGHTYWAGDWLGVCFEGDYEQKGAKMPTAQLEAGRDLARYLHRKYPGIPDRRHRDMPNNSTACPGKAFPFTAITGAR